MNFSVLSILPFDRQFKRISKKYPSLKKEFSSLIESLETQLQQGTSIGIGCYKIRLAIASKHKDKSGGARVITNIVMAANQVYLLTIYDKSEKENISDSELVNLIRQIS